LRCLGVIKSWKKTSFYKALPADIVSESNLIYNQFTHTFQRLTREIHMSLLSTHPQGFVHLHLHSQYSLLDGAIRLPDLIKKAKEFNMPAVAVTDHGNMFGAIDFYLQAKAAGIKPILGSEIYFTPGSRYEKKQPKKNTTVDSQDEMESRHHIHHLILLCKNNTGYENLCKLLSRAYLEGFYYKPRADLELLAEYSEGLIATTACLKGEVGYNFFTGQDDRAQKSIFKLKEIFKDDFYLEIQENGIPEQKIVNEKVVAFARANNISLVATNDCHYMTPEDAKAQEVLLCIQTQKTFADENRMKLSTQEFYFKSAELMRQKFSYAPEACDNTLKIADMCDVTFNWKDANGNQVYHLPDYPITTGELAADYFARVSREGMNARFKGPHFAKLVMQGSWECELKNKYLERLEDEIKMISNMGFAGYFLIVSDFIKWAKLKDIPVGPGRGSGAGSLVAYALDITNINPIPFNLLFERFINPERVSLPDFDVDFCQERRQEVINYVTEKYGASRVGQIITFGKLQAKAAIRDVARVYDLPYAEADALAKLVPDELGISLEEAIEKEPKITDLMNGDAKIRQIMNIARRLEGLLRHASIHAAGVIITNEPLVKYCPLFRGREGEQVVQFDKDFSEKIGLVKFDFLGLKTLTVIKTARDFIRRDHDKSFDIESIDYEDKNIYDFISEGETIGVFQLESSGMIDLCKRIKPGTLDDITAINALYRPGPLGSGMVDDFIEIKHGRRDMVFPFPELAPVLKDTYGVVVYQEQVMNTARVIAGYSLGQADMLRRAMGKKKADEMDRHKAIFLKGAEEKGFNLQKASDLFDLMAKFAEYGFNKSHAVAYADIAYQTAFLKYYYPAAFFAALLSTELSNMDKVTVYIGDAKRFEIIVLPPDVNESLWQFNVVGKNIRFGMGAVKNVGEGAVAEIIRERTEHGAFKGLVDFCERVNLKLVNKRVFESLIKVGAFDSCEKFNRKTLIDNLELVTGYAAKKQEAKSQGLVGLFDVLDEAGDSQERLDLVQSDDFSEKEKLGYEVELMGIYVSGHPLDSYQQIMKQLSSMPIHQVQEIIGQDKRELTLSGLVAARKNILTKKGDKMAFLNLEDLTGKIECVVFPRVLAEFEELLGTDEPLLVMGEVNLAESPRKFLPRKFFKLKKEAEDRITGVRLSLRLDQMHEHHLNKLKQTVMDYRGAIPIHLVFETNEGRARLPLGEDFLVNPSPQMAAKLNEIFNDNVVKFVIDGRLEDGVRL